MISTRENVLDIGIYPGLSLGPPARAGVRSKRGAVHHLSRATGRTHAPGTAVPNSAPDLRPAGARTPGAMACPSRPVPSRRPADRTTCGGWSRPTAPAGRGWPPGPCSRDPGRRRRMLRQDRQARPDGAVRVRAGALDPAPGAGRLAGRTDQQWLRAGDRRRAALRRTAWPWNYYRKNLWIADGGHEDAQEGQRAEFGG